MRQAISEEYLNFGKKLKSIRQSNKMTQDEMAKRMKVSKTTVINYEMGTRKIPLAYLVKFSNLFNVSVDDILGTRKESIGQLTDEEMAQVLQYAKFLISIREEK